MADESLKRGPGQPLNLCSERSPSGPRVLSSIRSDIPESRTVSLMKHGRDHSNDLAQPIPSGFIRDCYV